MIFKNNKQSTVGRRQSAAMPRARPPESTLSPRLVRLLHESWWFLVVVAFIYLALILATYNKADAGWSFSGVGAPPHNKGGVVGAWVADLLLYLFGLSAWWWVIAGVIAVVSGYRRLTHESVERHHPWLAIPGFALVLLASASLEALRLYRLPTLLPNAPGGALGDVIGQGLSRALGFNGATLLLIALFGIGWSLLTGMSWLRLMERIGGGIESTLAWSRRRREAQRDRVIGDAAFEEREQVVEAAREIIDDREPVMVVPAALAVTKSERVTKEKQKPLFQDLPDSPLPQ